MSVYCQNCKYFRHYAVDSHSIYTNICVSQAKVRKNWYGEKFLDNETSAGVKNDNNDCSEYKNKYKFWIK